MREKILMAIETTPESGFRFKTTDQLKDKQIKNAVKHIAKGKVAEKDILAVMDTTMFSSGKDGYLFTTDTLYSHSFNQPLTLGDITKVADCPKHSFNSIVTLKDGTELELYVSVKRDYINKLLNKIMETNAVPEPAAQKKPPVAAPKTEKAEPKPAVKKAAEPKPAVKKAAEPKPAVKKAAEPPKKAAEPPKKAAEPPKKAAEPPKKAAEPPKKAAEPPKTVAEPPKAVELQKPVEIPVPVKPEAKALFDSLTMWSKIKVFPGGNDSDGKCVCTTDEAELAKIQKAQDLDAQGQSGAAEHILEHLGFCGNPYCHYTVAYIKKRNGDKSGYLDHLCYSAQDGYLPAVREIYEWFSDSLSTILHFPSEYRHNTTEEYLRVCNALICTGDTMALFDLVYDMSAYSDEYTEKDKKNAYLVAKYFAEVEYDSTAMSALETCLMAHIGTD